MGEEEIKKEFQKEFESYINENIVLNRERRGILAKSLREVAEKLERGEIDGK